MKKHDQCPLCRKKIGFGTGHFTSHLLAQHHDVEIGGIKLIGNPHDGIRCWCGEWFRDSAGFTDHLHFKGGKRHLLKSLLGVKARTEA